MVTMGVSPFQGKTHMVEPGIEPGTSWLVVRSSDHQATRLVTTGKIIVVYFNFYVLDSKRQDKIFVYFSLLRVQIAGENIVVTMPLVASTSQL